MKILSASFFLAIGLGIGTLISAATNSVPSAGHGLAAETAVNDYAQVVETEVRAGVENAP